MEQTSNTEVDRYMLKEVLRTVIVMGGLQQDCHLNQGSHLDALHRYKLGQS